MKRFLFLSSISVLLSACAGGGGGGSGTTFVNFNTPAKSTTQTADTLTSEISYRYDSNGSLTFSDPELATGTVSATTDSSGTYSQYSKNGKNSSVNVGSDRQTATSGTATLISLKSADLSDVGGIVTDPTYSYQSYGFWNTGANQSGVTHKGGYFSAGTATPNAALNAKSGTASFSGTSVGTNWNSAGVPNSGSRGIESSVTMTADFSSRSGSIAFGNSKISNGSGSMTPDASFNMTGSLAWTSAANKFTGTLARNDGSTGALNGRFYGPNAEETGGVFYTKNSTSFYSGAFGAKKQ